MIKIYLFFRRNLQKIIHDRDADLDKEALRQQKNDKLRKEFAM